MGYCWKRFDRPVFLAGPKLLHTEIAIHRRLELCGINHFQKLANNTGNENDECISGTLTIFDPSNSTFVKHFIGRMNEVHNENYSFDTYSAGYVNTTTAITRAQFKFESGNIDSGTIKLYGVK